MWEQNYDYSKYNDDELTIEYHKLTEKIARRVGRDKMTMGESQIKTNANTLAILENHLNAVMGEMFRRVAKRQ